MEEIFKQHLQEWAKEKTIYQIVIAAMGVLMIVSVMAKHFKAIAEAMPSIRKGLSWLQNKILRRAIFEKGVMDELKEIKSSVAEVKAEVKYNGGSVFLSDVVKEISKDLKALSSRQDNTETRLEAGFQLAGRMYGVFNRDAECIEINPVFLKRFGWAKEDILQVSYENIVHEEDRRELQSKFARAITTGSKFSEPEIRLFDSNAGEHKVCMTGYPNFNRITEEVENYFVTFEILKQ